MGSANHNVTQFHQKKMSRKEVKKEKVNFRIFWAKYSGNYIYGEQNFVDNPFLAFPLSLILWMQELYCCLRTDTCNLRNLEPKKFKNEIESSLF